MTVLKGPALQAEAVRLARAGHRPVDIATRLNRRPGTIAAALSDARAAGLSVPSFRRGPSSVSLAGRRAAADARAREMATMREEGLSVGEIAVALRTTANAVSSAMSRGRRAATSGCQASP